MKHTLIASAFATLAASGATSLTIIVQNEFAGSSNPIFDELGATLNTGDVARLGYFELVDGPAVDGDLFTGFVPISTVLVNIDANGNFSQTITLDDMADLPGTTSQTLQFGIRFFNDSSEAAATFYNTVTDSDWQFTFSNAIPPPTDSEMLLDPILGEAGVVWEDGSASAFSTTIRTDAVPEPSTAISALLGLGFLLGSRRRK